MMIIRLGLCALMAVAVCRGSEPEEAANAPGDALLRLMPADSSAVVVLFDLPQYELEQNLYVTEAALSLGGGQPGFLEPLIPVVQEFFHEVGKQYLTCLSAQCAALNKVPNDQTSMHLWAKAWKNVKLNPLMYVPLLSAMDLDKTGNTPTLMLAVKLTPSSKEWVHASMPMLLKNIGFLTNKKWSYMEYKRGDRSWDGIKLNSMEFSSKLTEALMLSKLSTAEKQRIAKRLFELRSANLCVIAVPYGDYLIFELCLLPDRQFIPEPWKFPSVAEAEEAVLWSKNKDKKAMGFFYVKPAMVRTAKALVHASSNGVMQALTETLPVLAKALNIDEAAGSRTLAAGSEWVASSMSVLNMLGDESSCQAFLWHDRGAQMEMIYADGGLYGEESPLHLSGLSHVPGCVFSLSIKTSDAGKGVIAAWCGDMVQTLMCAGDAMEGSKIVPQAWTRSGLSRVLKLTEDVQPRVRDLLDRISPSLGTEMGIVLNNADGVAWVQSVTQRRDLAKAWQESAPELARVVNAVPAWQDVKLLKPASEKKGKFTVYHCPSSAWSDSFVPVVCVSNDWLVGGTFAKKNADVLASINQGASDDNSLLALQMNLRFIMRYFWQDPDMPQRRLRVKQSKVNGNVHTSLSVGE